MTEKQPHQLAFRKLSVLERLFFDRLTNMVLKAKIQGQEKLCQTK